MNLHEKVKQAILHYHEAEEKVEATKLAATSAQIAFREAREEVLQILKLTGNKPVIYGSRLYAVRDTDTDKPVLHVEGWDGMVL